MATSTVIGPVKTAREEEAGKRYGDMEVGNAFVTMYGGTVRPDGGVDKFESRCCVGCQRQWCAAMV